MNDAKTPKRPAVIDDLTSSQFDELELQANEYDEAEFRRIASNYGWDNDTVDAVWRWFEVMNNYPLEEGEELG